MQPVLSDKAYAELIDNKRKDYFIALSIFATMGSTRRF